MGQSDPRSYANKRLTPDGKAKKERIVDNLFHQKRKVQLMLSLFTSVLHIVCHILREFLALCIKPELLGGSGQQLADIDANDKSNQLSEKKTCFLGRMPV